MPHYHSWRQALLAGVSVYGLLAATGNCSAQSIVDLKMPSSPLVLKAIGSLLIGGDEVAQSAIELSSPFNSVLEHGGHVVINQMYVQFLIPMSTTGPPVVLLHGGSLTGKTYETTPDGRMGWEEYFLRRGHAVYVPDQVSRGRSGMDIATYNEVRSGKRPPGDLANAYRHSSELNWTNFRFGPKVGVPFPDEQFPVAAVGRLAAQAVPDFNAILPRPNPTYRALAELAAQLHGAVIVGHSESGSFPLEAALTDITGIRGLVLIEPGRCGSPNYTDTQIATLAAVPILVVFGDHLDVATGQPFSWTTAYDSCKAFVARLNAAHGQAQLLHLPELGIHGNSHMMMQDKNNLRIADLILDWIRRNVTLRRTH